MVHQTEYELVRWVLRQIDPHPIVREVIDIAYLVNYDQYSDGITLMHELNFRGMKMKHPIGVGHDLLYALGVKSPWLPKSATSDTAARRWADNWFRDSMRDFGHWARAPVWWLGLRIGAWHGWDCHRRICDPTPELLNDVVHEWRRARILGELSEVQ